MNAPIAGLVNAEPETGGQFVLRQNYPNPFTASTAIAFSLAAPSRVELEVFDMAGNRIARILDGALPTGDHNIAWDRIAAGKPVASGNYLFQLSISNSAGDFRQVKVMTVR